MFYSIIDAAWNVFVQGYMIDHQLPYNRSLLNASLVSYDQAWASYKALALIHQDCPSLYNDYYFNLPGAAPEPGMGATVDKYRNATLVAM